MLRRVAELLVEDLRGEDIVVRTGGEEFAVLMPGTEPAAAAAVLRAPARGDRRAWRWDALARGWR